MCDSIICESYPSYHVGNPSKCANILQSLYVLCESHGKLLNQLEGDTLIAMHLVMNERLWQVKYICPIHKRTVLHWATGQRNKELVFTVLKILLTDMELVGFLGATDVFGQTALDRLLLKGEHEDCVELVVKFGAKMPPQRHLQRYKGLLHYLRTIVWSRVGRINFDIFKFRLGLKLVELNFSANRANISMIKDDALGFRHQNNSLLHMVSTGHGNNVAVIRYLLQTGADPAMCNAAGKTSLHILCGASLDNRDDRQWNGCDDAQSEKDRKQVLTMFLFQNCRKDSPINLVDNRLKSALHYAARNGSRISLVPILLAQGANLTHVDDSGNTPLHTAFPDESVWKSVLNPLDCSIRLALETRNDRGATVLHKHFSLNGESAFVRLLINLGALPGEYEMGRNGCARYNMAVRFHSQMSGLGPWRARRFLSYPSNFRNTIRTILCIWKVDIIEKKNGGQMAVSHFPQSGICELPIEIMFFIFEIICVPPYLGILNV